MKILMTTSDHLMIDRRILQEAKSLVNLGHEVTLLAGFECPTEESYEYDGIKIKRFVYDWYDPKFAKFAKIFRLTVDSKKYFFLNKVYQFVAYKLFKVSNYNNFILDKMNQEKPDILHIHDFPMLKTGVIFSKRNQIKLIYDAHELYYSQVQLPKKIQKKYKKEESKLIRHANQVITVNPYIAKLMVERYKIETPNIIMNALPFNQISEDKTLKERFNISGKSKILLYQGWISENRGIEKIIEAARYFDSSICLILIGYGDYLHHLKNLVDKYGLNERVFFYGEVPSKELHNLTCQADLGIIPYYPVDENNYYCSPNKLFEFTMAHVPFISNELPFLSDMIFDYQFGEVCDLNNPHFTAKLVNKILLDSERLERLKLAAKKASKILNWENEQLKLYKIYDEL